MTTCPVCGEIEAGRLFARPPDHDPKGRPFTVVRCAGCRTERLDPPPTEQELDEAYRGAYYDLRSPDAGVAGRLRQLAWRSEVRPLAALLRPGMRVLEVGCGTGELLAWLRERFGVIPLGLDTTPAAVEAARARGVDARRGTLDEGAVEPGSVDAIVMRHVLEHVPSPRALLSAARAALVPGGAALCTVPVTEGWDHRAFGNDWEGYEIPQHLYLFPPDAVVRLFREAGFRVVGRRFSLVPNPWVKGAAQRMRARGWDRAAAAVTIRNPIALALAVPFGAAAGVARRSGRMSVLARAPRERP